MKKSFLIMSVILFGITITSLTSCGTGADDTGSVSFVIDGSQIARLAEASALKTGTFSLQTQSLEDATGPLTGDTSASDSFVKYGWYFFPADDPEFSSKTLSEWYIGSSNDKDDNLLEVNSLFLFKDNTFLTTIYKAEISGISIGKEEKRLEFQGEYTIGEAKTVPGDNTTVTMTPLTLSIKEQWNKTSAIWAAAEADMTINASVTEITMDGKTSKAIKGTLGNVTKSFVKISGEPGETSADDIKSGMTLTIALPGSGQKPQTLTYTPDDLKAGKKQAVTFDDIPADSTVRALATLTAETSIDGESLTSLVAYGFSESSKIIAGSNSLTLPMQTVSALSTKELVSKNKKPFSGTDTREEKYLLYVFKSESQTGDWAIVYENAIVSAGSYTILSTNDNNNPASLSLTEFIYLDPKDEKYHTVAAPQAKTYPVEDGKLSITGTNGVQLTFTVSENDEPEPEPEPTYPAGGTFVIDDSKIEITADWEEDSLYLNYGTISFNAYLKSKGLEEGKIDTENLNVRFFYGNNEVDSDCYHINADGFVTIGGTSSFAVGGTYQMYVTARDPDSGSSGSALFNVEINNKAYFYLPVDETIDKDSPDYYMNYLAEQMKNISTPSIVKVVGEGIETVFDKESYKYTTSGTLKNISEAIQGTDSSYNNIIHPVELDLSELTGVTKIEKRDISATAIASLTLPGTITTLSTAGFSFDSKYIDGQYYDSQLVSVTIPEGVTTIEDEAFSGCASLVSIEIPKSVTTIGSSPFSSCRALKKLTVAEENRDYCTNTAGSILLKKTDGIPTTIMLAFDSFETLDFSSAEYADVTEIAANAFESAKITELKGLESITTLGDGAFSYANIDSLTLSSLIAVQDGEYPFYATSVKNLTIDFEITSETADAFEAMVGRLKNNGSYSSRNGFSNIENLVFNKYAYIKDSTLSSSDPESASAESSMFYSSSSTLKTVAFNKGAYIGKYQFLGFSDIESITFGEPEGDKETAFGDSPFSNYYCYNRNVTSLNLAGVKTLNYRDFYNFTALTEVTLPACLESISNGSFEGCSALEKFTIAAGNTHLKTDPAGKFIIKLDPAGYAAVAAVYANLGAIDFTGTEVKTIESMVFLYRDITSLNLSGVEHIKDQQTLMGLSSLQSLDLGENLKDIGRLAFKNCASSQSEPISVTLPNSLVGVYAGAFNKAKISFTLPDDYTSAGDWYVINESDYKAWIVTPPAAATFEAATKTKVVAESGKTLAETLTSKLTVTESGNTTTPCLYRYKN